METTDRRQKVFDWLDSHGIAYTWYEHPEAPTIEIARRYWRDDGSKHCKNLFFRNHKGNRHYLVAFDCEQNLAIHDLERRLRQGKLSFASEQRMERWLGLRPGSVSPFGLINDPERHVHLFLDRNLDPFPYTDGSGESVPVPVQDQQWSIEDEELHYQFHIRTRILVEETENLMQEMEENNVGIKEND